MNREPFMKMILEHPEDDAPRLVFADWLEENGDPDRAEFIRLQIQLEPVRLEEAKSPNSGWRVMETEEINAKRMRVAQILDTYSTIDGITQRNEWHWHPSLGTGLFEFRRGFAEFLECGIGDWYRMATTVISLCPIREVQLHGWPDMRTWADEENRVGWVECRVPHGVGYFSRAPIPMENIRFARSVNQVSQMVYEAADKSSRRALKAAWPKITFKMPIWMPPRESIFDLMDRAPSVLRAREEARDLMR